MLTPTGITLSEYNSALLNERATHIRIVFPVQNVTFTDDDISANGGISLLQVLNTETDLTMGNAVSGQITINFLNNGQFVGMDWTEEFRVDLGVDVNGTTDWVTIGYFKGQRPDRVARVETIVFTARDRMQKFDLLADDFVDSLTFPMTMAQVYSALCTYVGVQSIQGNEIADSMALSYAENPFRQGLTCRQILAWIAEANCCYAKIDNSGKVKLTWFTDHTSDYSIDGDSYYNIELAEISASAPDSVRIASTDTDGVSLLYPLTGVETYQIIDNPFLLHIEYSDKVAFITELLTRFGNTTPYIPTNLNAVGNWMVETGDIIEVEYDNGSTMNMPIFARTMQWNGGCEDVYECSGQDKRSEMTESARITYEEGGKLAQKYTVRSGIDITDAGIQVSGGKYVKIVSGGTFDVDSTNFKINSQYKRIIAGKWQFDDFGTVYYDEDENTGFEIAENDDGAVNLSGIYYHYGQTGTLEYGQIIISPGSRSEGVDSKSRFIFQNQYDTSTQSMNKYFYPVRRSVDGFTSCLGSLSTPWDYSYLSFLRADFIDCIPDSSQPNKNYVSFRGNIRVDRASPYVLVADTTMHCNTYITVNSSGLHGLRSSGYWNGSEYIPDPKFMVHRDTDGKVYFDGYTIEKSVPSDAVFTDTWRPVVDNLTSTSTTSALSANQGKVLNDKLAGLVEISDCDNATDPSVVYLCKGTTTNTPVSGGWYHLKVFKYSTYYEQVAFGINLLNPQVYVRSNNDNQFGPWMQISNGYSKDLGTFGSQSALDSALTTFNSSIGIYTKAKARFTTTAAFGPFTVGTGYFIELSKGATGTYSSATITPVGGNVTIRACKDANGWYYSAIPSTVLTGGDTLPNNTDLNNVRTTGMYLLSGSNTYTNKPHSDSYALVVFKSSNSSNTVSQLAIGSRKIHIRIASNATTWNDWRSLDRYGKEWLASTDLNNVIIPGIYGLDATKTYTHGPVSGINGIMEVIAPAASETYIIQRITGIGYIYTRYRANSSGTAWTGWYKYTGTAV